MTARTMPQIAIGTLLLALMCVLSGHPQIFADTKAYYALGQALAAVSHASTDASIVALRGGHVLPPGDAALQMRLAYTVAATRSPVWSLFFYLVVQIGTTWLYVAVQSFLAAGTLWLAARAFDVRRHYLPIVVVLAALSSLPIFVLFMMPDIFTGLAILAAGTILLRGPALTRWPLVLLWLIAAAGALVHTSHVLILGALGAGSLLVALLWQPSLKRGSVAIVGAALCGLLAAIAFPLAVKAVRHENVYAPPFLAVRMIADGPGRRTLRDTCRTGAEWGLCRFKDRPLNDVNQILWDKDPRTRVFQTPDYDLRVRIINEQSAFVLATIRNYPWPVLKATATDVLYLLGQYGTREVLDDPTPRYRDPSFAILSTIVPGTDGCRTGAASCASRLDIALLDRVIGATLLISLVVIGGLLVVDAPSRRRWLPLTIFLFAALLANAFLCGALSGAAERYQSRVTWLIPMLATFMLAGLWDARQQRLLSSSPADVARRPSGGGQEGKPI